MSKVWTFMGIIIATAFLLKFAGIDNGLSSFLVNVGLSTTGTTLGMNNFLFAIVGVFSVVLVGTAVAGLISGSAPDFLFLAPFAAATLISFIGIFTTITNYPFSTEFYFIRYIVLFIWGLLGFMFTFGLIEWVFGR